MSKRSGVGESRPDPQGQEYRNSGDRETDNLCDHQRQEQRSDTTFKVYTDFGNQKLTEKNNFLGIRLVFT